jgi:hypothetical protein
MSEPGGRVFGFAVKRTLEWSKKYFEQRRATFPELSHKDLDKDPFQHKYVKIVHW